MRKIDIAVDADKVVGPLRHNWRYIGYDECNYTHAPEGEALLAKFGTLADAPYYVRMHHLLCNGNLHGVYKWGSTNLYTEDGEGGAVYDFTTVDKINGILKKHNAVPFFELGFMPMQLADNGSGKPETNFKKYQTEIWSRPPKDYDKWYRLIYKLVSHCAERHGKDEVLRWYWELWNEPDIFYWTGTSEEYFKLYDYTEAAVHAALPGARLSGPATTGPKPGSNAANFLDAFLDHCKNGTNYVTGEKGTRLDFVTFHTKGGGFPYLPDAPKATPSVNSLVLQVKTGCEIVKKYGYGDREIVLSEADPDGWAAGGRFDNRNMNFRNTEYYASYIASGYKNIENTAKSLDMDVRPLAWAFMFAGERCFEGTRTFSTQGIDKASFNLFKMYSRLGGEELALESSGARDITHGKDGFATGELPEVSGTAAKSGGGVQVMVYSHHDDWDINTASRVALKISGLEPGARYRVTHYRIDAEHSNAYRQWLTEGSPDYPTAEQYARIKARDGLEVYELFQNKESKAGELCFEFDMPAHGISLFDAERQ